MINPSDKPLSMSVKDYIIRVMSIRTKRSDKIIDAVVTHQFQKAIEATETCNSIEFSGFGKLFFNEKKARRRLANFTKKAEEMQKKLDEGGLTDVRREYITRVLTDLKKSIEVLKPKINEIDGDLRGVEKQAPPCSRYEESDRRYFESEEANM
jgi:nucleoid DNA-binding protein